VMFERRRGAPWLPALIAGGVGAALISRRARWHAAHHGYGAGFGGPGGGPGFGGPGGGGPGFGGRGPWGRGLPPMIEEMLNAWHKQAHAENPPTAGKAEPTAPEPSKGEA
jgi:hypothetical protein